MINMKIFDKHVDIFKEGATVIVRNSRVNMQENNQNTFMWLLVDRWGKIEEDSKAYEQEINTANDMSGV